MRSAWLLVLLFTGSGCALLSRHGGLSVEKVLRDANRNAVASEEPASAKLQPPLRQMRVNSRFGYRSGGTHSGVDLKAAEGTPFYAAGDGRVVYAGEEIGGYGLTVIVRHAAGFATLYAHASDLRVEVGQKVARGECLGYTGQSGNATGPHLHFEIRRDARPLDPVRMLAGPAPRPAERVPAASEDLESVPEDSDALAEELAPAQ
jgi:murein DD-endopeptidase MepM/ murein hydrolase activator NlpD